MVKTITEQEAIQLLEEFKKNRSKQDQRALCCLLGAYCGDNLGNYNEFSHSISEEDLEQAMKMPGYGAHNLIPGQSTDDTELATSLGYALIENPDPNMLDCNLFSKYYSLWIQSPPFDLGMTIGAALGVTRKDELTYETSSQDCKQHFMANRNRLNTKNQNRHSQSNGGVMRISPLCVYLSKQTDQQAIRKYVYAEQTLTHISKPALEAAYVYVRIVTNIIKGLNATQVVQDLTNYFQDECKDEDVKDWWESNLNKTEYQEAVLSMGWIKHALTQCFVALNILSKLEKEGAVEQVKQEIYKEFLKDILRLCGDSDTNAAIVGGMIGAYLTLEEFPQDYLKKIVECNLQDNKNSQLFHPREEIFNPRNCIYLCDEILKKASDNPNIEIIDGQLTDEIIKKIQDYNDIKVKEKLKKYMNKEEDHQKEKKQNLEEQQLTNWIQDKNLSKAGDLVESIKQFNNQHQISFQQSDNNQDLSEQISDQIQNNNQNINDQVIVEEEANHQCEAQTQQKDQDLKVEEEINEI
ncbi:hypothetical protein ABPG74_021946 [Tetrahymena malaccensis]